MVSARVEPGPSVSPTSSATSRYRKAAAAVWERRSDLLWRSAPTSTPSSRMEESNPSAASIAECRAFSTMRAGPRGNTRTVASTATPIPMATSTKRTVAVWIVGGQFIRLTVTMARKEKLAWAPKGP